MLLCGWNHSLTHLVIIYEYLMHYPLPKQSMCMLYAPTLTHKIDHSCKCINIRNMDPGCFWTMEGIGANAAHMRHGRLGATRATRWYQQDGWPWGLPAATRRWSCWHDRWKSMVILLLRLVVRYQMGSSTWTYSGWLPNPGCRILAPQVMDVDANSRLHPITINCNWGDERRV